MKRIYLYLLLLAAGLVPAAVFAVTSDADITLVLPSDSSNYTLKSGATFDILSIDGDTITFTAQTGGTVSVDLRSGDKKKLTNNRNIATTCGDSESKLVISTGPGDTTVTPSGSCTATGGGGGTSGGGSGTTGAGGGGGGFAPAPAAVDKVTQLKQQIAQVQAQIAQKLAQAGTTVAAAVTTRLGLGDRSDEVKTLQQLLGRDKDVYPEGLATGFFGPATQRAVKRFQEKYGIPSIGIVGPQTRAKLAEVFGLAPVAAPVAPPAAPAAEPAPVSAVSIGIPSRNLAPGERNEQVKALQQLLAGDPEVYPEGIASGYFGPATTRAVKKFQEKYGLPAVGNVGPKTRAKLEEIFGGAAAAPAPAPVSGETPTPAPAPAAGNDAQIKAVQEQIQAIQAKIIQEQIKLIQEKIKALQK